MRVSKAIAQFQRTGWKLQRIIDFKNDKKSVNYIFENGDEKRVIFTKNNIVKKIDVTY